MGFLGKIFNDISEASQRYQLEYSEWSERASRMPNSALIAEIKRGGGSVAKRAAFMHELQERGVIKKREG